MDIEGITWAGNIYQKFEAMCLEVEEVMYEDTANYVENQVQKVGVSVKNFYAEILQDLLPTSCVDPAEVAPGDLPLKPYTQSDINKKRKSSILEELDKKETKEGYISDQTVEESTLNACNDASCLLPLSSGVLVENTRSDVFSTKCKKVGVYKHPIGIKRISKNNHPPKLSRALTSLSDDARRSLLKASDDVNITKSAKFFVRNDPGEAATENTPIGNASLESCSSNQNLSAESVELERKDSQFTFLASENISSDESPGENNDDSNHKSSGHGSPTEPICTPRDKSRIDCPLPEIKLNIGSGTCDVEPVGEEVIASSEDYAEVIETGEVPESRVKLFEPVKKSNLEESCILVELDMLDFDSQGTKKHKSYKKKIREALSSTLRSTRTQDPGEKKQTSKGVVKRCEDRTLAARDSYESDWELL